MQKELCRLNSYLKDFPNMDIWVVSQDGVCAKAYWDCISEHVETKKKPVFITKQNHYKDGCSAFNSIILLCGHWYENPIAFSETFKMRLSEAKFTLPIGEMPEPNIFSEVKEENAIDYKEMLGKQVKKLEERQEKGNLNVEDICMIAKTIDYLLTSIVKYEKRIW